MPSQIPTSLPLPSESDSQDFEAAPVQTVAPLVVVRSIDDMIENAVDETKELIRTASGLAALLNNDRVRLTHLLLALTLTPRGVERLQYHGMSKTHIRAACWKITDADDPVAEGYRVPPFSDNVEEVIRLAQRDADVRAHRITVDEIVQVINREPLKSRYQHLWNGAGREDPIQSLTHHVDEAHNSIMRAIQTHLTKTESDIATITTAQNKKFKHIKHNLNITMAATLTTAAIVVAALIFAR